MPGQYMQRTRPFYEQTSDETPTDTTTRAPFKKPPTVADEILIEEEVIR